MGDYHDKEATRYGDIIKQQIRIGDPEFKQIFSSDVVRVGYWDWPRPDYVCFDERLNATYALEFKPPEQNKRKYITGLGQALSYLQHHTYSGLIIPFVADDGFNIAEYIGSTLLSTEFENVPTSLFAYSPNDSRLHLLRGIDKKRNLEGIELSSASNDAKTFWCWWRDTSHYELYNLLNLSFIYGDEAGDIYTNKIYPHFYDLMIKGETRQWDGSPRKKIPSDASFRAEKQNYKIPLSQLELWTSSEGRLTYLGFEFLYIGKKYGPNSKKFLDKLAYTILVNGKHLDLIRIIDKYQKSNSIPEKSMTYAIELDGFLTENGFIGTRKPTAVKTGAKMSYLRDEMKLWNKLGLLNTANKKSYFFPSEGYRFDWAKITSLLISV